jgi:hypothetical protein
MRDDGDGRVAQDAENVDAPTRLDVGSEGQSAHD